MGILRMDSLEGYFFFWKAISGFGRDMALTAVRAQK